MARIPTCRSMQVTTILLCPLLRSRHLRSLFNVQPTFFVDWIWTIIRSAHWNMLSTISSHKPCRKVSVKHSATYCLLINENHVYSHCLRHRNLFAVLLLGLKVKLSLPDDGFIVENLADANQSWMYRRDELLYFWRDPFHSKIVVIISINRLSYYSTAPYSASLFCLRGHESAQSFVQRAQDFFALLSAPPARGNASLEKSSTIDSRRADSKKRKEHKHKKSKSSVVVQEPPTKKSSRSSQPAPMHSVTRTEFDPGQRSTGNSLASVYNRRTYSDTTVSSDSASKTNHQWNGHEDDDDRMTSASARFSIDYVAELVHELKELRNEIASLKLESRTTPVRSTSTSPLHLPPEPAPSPVNDRSAIASEVSHDDIDAETQTDHTLFNYRRQQLAKKNKTSVPSRAETQTSPIKRKSDPTTSTDSKRPVSNGRPDRNGKASKKNSPLQRVCFLYLGTALESASHVNGTSNGESAGNSTASYQTAVVLVPQRSLSSGNETYASQSNGTRINSSARRSIANSHEEEEEEDEEAMLQDPSVPMRKQRSNFLPTHDSFSVERTAPMTVSFRSEVEDTLDPSEHIYENIPILIHTSSNQAAYYNIPIIKGNNSAPSNGYVYVTINDDQAAKSQEQQSRSQSMSEHNGLSTPQEMVQEAPSIDYQRTPPQIHFADHLTNPLFNTDKQLLANTIANQFGIDLQSPYLPQLISNQHLFVAQKRTYANMVWQLTADEMRNLCSSPITTKTNSIALEIDSSTSAMTKSILKSQRSLSSFSKRQRITWNPALD